MADCLAGVWAKNSNDRFNAIDDSDIETGGRGRAGHRRRPAAAAEPQGEVVPDSFTHGSSEQRVRWLLTGFKSGQVQSCDTFRTSRL